MLFLLNSIQFDHKQGILGFALSRRGKFTETETRLMNDWALVGWGEWGSDG